MTVYAWPSAWVPSAFELRILPNTRTFVGAYTPVVQVIDLLGERWQGRLDLQPTTSLTEAGAREAFADRLKGQANQFSIWNFRRPVPLGTIGATVTVAWTDAGAVSWTDGSGGGVTWIDGAPVTAAAIAQGANTTTLQVRPGATVLAGDMLGLPNGQAVRCMADATADGGGALAVEFQPRARSAMSAYGAINLTRPTFNVMLKAGDGIPTTYRPGYAEGWSIEFVEVP